MKFGADRYQAKHRLSEVGNEMSSSTLKATTGSPPFKGLDNNDSAFLIVGSETQAGSIAI